MIRINTVMIKGNSWHVKKMLMLVGDTGPAGDDICSMGKIVNAIISIIRYVGDIEMIVSDIVKIGFDVHVNVTSINC